MSDVTHDWTEEELSLIGWQWAGDVMRVLDKNPTLWQAWLEYARQNVPITTTDSKVAQHMKDFVVSNKV